MKIAIVLGTRPEIIKLSPLIRLLAERKQDFFVVHTGQHFSKNMSEQFFDELNIPLPKYDLLSSPRRGPFGPSHPSDRGNLCVIPTVVEGSLYQKEIATPSTRRMARNDNRSLANMIPEIITILKKENPNTVIVQGDTKSALAGALAASYLNIKLAHVEAGLRSFDDSMPEEVNRIVIDRLSDVLLCPSNISKNNLKSEKVRGQIYVVGNTISDVTAENIKRLPNKKYSSEEYALLTLHRPANVDGPEDLKDILHTVSKIASKYSLKLVFPVHPRTKKVLKKYQINICQNIKLVPPMKYLQMLRAVRDAKLILTDSGGLQEEACILGVPCVTLRENTERPETVSVGANIIAGKDEKAILSAVKKILKSKRNWSNPFGERVSEKILDILGRT